MVTRRNFLQRGAQAGIVAATSPLWSNFTSTKALAQAAGSSYKAIVVITLAGGCDGNNVLVPIDSASWAQYAATRGGLALNPSQTVPLTSSAGSPNFGLHPSLQNVAAMYNSKRALVVGNVGPMILPATKSQLLSNSALLPQALLSHVSQRAQWESADVVESPTTGWGGRVADLLVSQSGSLPGVLNAGPNSTFTFGNSVQAVAVQGGGASAMAPAMNAAILQIAQNDATASTALVSQAAQFRAAAMQQQVLLSQAAQYGTLKTAFPVSQACNTGFLPAMQTIANIINGRSVIGASRQIFYTQQGGGQYDTHLAQLYFQSICLQELDSGLGCFFAALDEMGLTNQVLVCTHSDFSRTMTPNTNGGTDHAWGTNQLILGGGISGGRILGTLPDMDINGACDITGQGVWIPTTSVTQMTAGIGSWLGLNAAQTSSVFPMLGNFPTGMIQL